MTDNLHRVDQTLRQTALDGLDSAVKALLCLTYAVWYLCSQGLHLQGRVIHLRQLTHDEPQRMAPVLDHPSAWQAVQGGLLRGGGEWR